MSRSITLAAVALAAAMASTGAPAQQETPGGVITMDEARRIATGHGVVRIEEIELDDGKWQIEGRDAVGASIEIDLRASDGGVLKIERDRPVTAGAAP